MIPCGPAWVPTRAGGLARLAAFVPRAGAAYARDRNADQGPGAHTNVSALSPYLRHRLVTEQETVAAVLDRHAPSTAEKFVQEVCWRTYWKGWLEHRPAVWRAYQADVARLGGERETDAGLRARLLAAEAGRTGIACFDAWVGELVATGYLHNHARMWFASIWVYTLGLPWQLGADLFMRHLIDGDPASNTLSWRWVCGLHTAGKTYLARAGNIARYTSGRFDPAGQLATDAPALADTFEIPRPARLVAAAKPIPGERAVLILTEDDLAPESWPVARGDVAAVVGLRTAHAYPGTAANVAAFKQSALADAIARAQARFSCPVLVLPAEDQTAATHAMGHAQHAGAAAFVTMACPVGPAGDATAPVLASVARGGWPVRTLRRDWDDMFWPHATHGFFKLKEKIPAVLSALAEADAPQRRLL